MSKTTKFLISLSIFLMLIMPIFSFAEEFKVEPKKEDCDPDSLLPCWHGLVPCGREVQNKGDATGQTPIGTNNETDNIVVTDSGQTVKKPCGFNDLMDLVNNIIRFVLFYLAIPIIAIMFTYAGILLVTSGGDTGARTKAKGIFLNAAIGLALMVGCWLIVRTILSILGYNGSWIFEGF